MDSRESDTCVNLIEETEQQNNEIDNIGYLEENYGSMQAVDDINYNNNAEYIASTCADFTVDTQESDKTSGRKRKLDEDGFVTPATPDIPKSSSKYDHQLNGGEYENYYEDYDKSTEHTNSNYNDEDPLLSNTTHYQSAVDLLRDKAEEFKMVTMEWCNDFGDSENFESFCASRLDQLIADARNLESNLRKQKEILRQRLGFISRTLQEV